MTRHRYALEFGPDYDVQQILDTSKRVAAALRNPRTRTLSFESGIHITDLGPTPTRIRMVDVERHHAR